MARTTDPLKPNKRGLLKTVLGKPFNARLGAGKAPVQTGGVVVPKFRPSAIVKRPSVQAPKLPVAPQGFRKSDNTFTKFNTKTKITTRYNADGSLFRKGRPAGRRTVPAGAGGRGTRVVQAQ